MHDGSTASLIDWIKSNDRPFRIAGRGTWLNAGRPVVAEQQLSMSNCSGIVEYIPGDLTMTVRAGTTHEEIDELTRREGQWLGLDAVMCKSGTIGATIATASSGPLSHSTGGVRDIVLGLESISGNGIPSRGGGKVVKNVAGYDLVRLHTGAFGTLGVITEASLRLRALPEVDRTFALELDARTPLLAHLVKLRSLTMTPLALELIGASLAELLGLTRSMHIVVRLGGNEPRVSGQQSSLATLGSLVELPTAFWNAVNVFEGTVGTNGMAVARITHLPSRLSNIWSHVQNEVSSSWSHPFFMRATVSRGSVRVVIPNVENLSDEQFGQSLIPIIPLLTPPGGHVVWEQLPANAWLHVPSLVDDALSRGLQRMFDPDSRCNPRILGAPFKS